MPISPGQAYTPNQEDSSPPLPALVLHTRTSCTVSASALRSSTIRLTRIMFTRFSTEDTAMRASRIRTRINNECMGHTSCKQSKGCGSPWCFRKMEIVYHKVGRIVNEI